VLIQHLERASIATSTRKRNPNFFETELQIPLKEVEKCKDVLFSKLSTITTNNPKKRVWETICEKVNSCNSTGHNRNVEEIRKKCRRQRRRMQSREERLKKKKTGEGPPPGDLTHLEETVIGIIGDTLGYGYTSGWR
jgi:hypothetical protein